LSFTKESWSGKSPKQYFIDYLSKHAKLTKVIFTLLDKSSVEYRCSVKLIGGHVKYEGKSCVMGGDEVVTTAKDAEHYVAVL
jgi:hypothetical protein